MSTSTVTANPMRQTYPRFAIGSAENVENLTSRIVNLQHTLETKDAEIATLTERISSQDERLEELTGRCSASERSKRKMESELEKRIEENTKLQKPIAEEEKAKRTPRKALAALNSNTDGEAAPQ